MDNNKIDSRLDLLDQIQKVEAPLFLLTRIKQKINSAESVFFSPKLTWAFIVILILVLMLNATIMIKKMNEDRNAKSIVEAMHLLPDNSLYK